MIGPIARRVAPFRRRPQSVRSHSPGSRRIGADCPRGERACPREVRAPCPRSTLDRAKGPRRGRGRGGGPPPPTRWRDRRRRRAYDLQAVAWARGRDHVAAAGSGPADDVAGSEGRRQAVGAAQDEDEPARLECRAHRGTVDDRAVEDEGLRQEHEEDGGEYRPSRSEFSRSHRVVSDYNVAPSELSIRQIQSHGQHHSHDRK